MDTPTQLPQDQIDDIKKEAKQLTGTEGTGRLQTLYKRYKEIYFMTAQDSPRGNNIDKDDWKVTISPSGRNTVTGMKRLLDTAEVHVEIKVDGDKAGNSDKIEKALKKILAVSGMNRPARIEKDLNLSAVLFGPAVLAAESVADLIAVQKKPANKKYLEKIGKYTPFLLKTINPEQSFSRWGEFGMGAHLRKYQVTGAVAEERWGVAGLSRSAKYTVMHWIDRENTVAWIEGRKEVLIAKPHGMPSMNVAARLAGGNSLFDNSDEQMQSFLYAHVKGEWDRRENLFYTYLFSALFMQGLPGPLLIVDPTDLGDNRTLDIDLTGGIRKIFAKAQVADYPVIDSDVMQIKGILDQVGADSTIYQQTLGQGVQGTTFSGLAMLSSAGQLPLEDPKEALAFVYRDIFEHILCRTKEEGIDTPMLSAADIPDEYEIEVSLEPKLPQDNLRNAQVAQSLGDLVSDEWKHSQLLQINDSKSMRKQSMKEQLFKQLLGAMLQKPDLVDEFINTALGRKQAQPPNVGGTTPPEEAMPTGPETPPEGGMPPGGPGPSPDQMMQSQPGMMQGVSGAEQMPMQNPVPGAGEPGGPGVRGEY